MEIKDSAFHLLGMGLRSSLLFVLGALAEAELD